MDAKSKQVNQDTIHPSPFNLGELVLADFEGNNQWRPSVICPNFGSGDRYTEVKKLKKRGRDRGLFRFYHVQWIGHNFRRAWLPSYLLRPYNSEVLQTTSESLTDKKTKKAFQKFVGKTNEEMVEICRVKYETFDSFKQDPSNSKLVEVVDAEILDLKTDDIDLKFQLKRLRDNFEQYVNSQNQNKPQNEQECELNNKNQDPVNAEQYLVTKVQEENDQLKNELKILKESLNELKKSFQDLKELVMSQDQNKPQNEQETTNNENVENENKKYARSDNTDELVFENPFEFEKPLKKIKLEDQSEEIQKLNQVIKDLKEGNLKLQTENIKLSKANDDYEEVEKTTIECYPPQKRVLPTFLTF